VLVWLRERRRVPPIGKDWVGPSDGSVVERGWVPGVRDDAAVTRLGVVFLPQFAPERLRDVAQAADAAGLEELWLWEDCFRESGIAAGAAVLAWTRRLQVGIGLLPAPLRNVALTAMEVATLDRLFPGRLRLGVGHGVQEWMGQVGARVASPMTLLREYLAALRALLAGERVSTEGRYVRLTDVALDWPPPAPPSLLVGAVGPRTLRLSGELADGTILTAGTTPAAVRQACEHIADGRTVAGRTDPHQVTVYLLAATGPGATDRVRAECRGWERGNAAEAAVAGDAEEIAGAVARWAAAGADTVVLQPTGDEPDPEGFVRFVASGVRPLLPG
jgi:alkanesulfonate monooxygenase SsuD/methylene tetrahydromethanopterin reductase-like flavin-dependent oxidoreductase (luciferase family)